MSGNTMRSTPNRTQGRGAIPFGNSPAGGASGIPRPVFESQPSETTSSVSASRQKQSKRDEAIRRKMESDLSKKKHLTNRARHTRKAPPGTVLALKPSPALQIKPATTVSEAAQLMAAKREDCVLVTDDDDRIAGIFTAKDLAFRVVGAGHKAANITIAEIMTKNPLCARTDTSATDALDLMVRKGFRHLPVMDENQDISGVLDITKCFYDAMEKLERAYASSRKLYDALEGVQSELGATQPQQIIQYVEALRSKMSGPTLESVLNGIPPTTVSVRTSVKEAAAMMKEHHTTAVLVQDQGAITGIFTSKDVVLRVIAPGLDPANCSVVRVMTPHPDFAPMDMTIQAALRKMHDGHYLNLPVMNDGGEIVGMVDVLKLTYATLEQINTMSSGDSEGPAWNKFWLSIDNETESMVSGEGSHSQRPTNLSSRLMSPEAARERVGNDSVLPGDSASHVGADSPCRSLIPETPEPANPADAPFPFKFKAPSGRVHRLQVTASHGLDALVSSVAAKLRHEVDAIGGVPVVEEGKMSDTGFALSYMDDEGDTVSITTDHDLVEAIVLARQRLREKVDLFVHDPEEPPVAAAAAAAAVETTPVIPTPLASSASLARERRRTLEDDYDDDDDEGADADADEKGSAIRRARRTRPARAQEQLVAGVPNDLLLPGAIVTLAAVIVGVFAANSDTNGSSEGSELKPAALAGNRRIGQAPKPSQTRKNNRQMAAQQAFVSLAAGELRSHQGLPWTRSRKVGDMIVTPAQQYAEFQRIRWQSRGLGSELKKRFVPSDLINDPPAAEDVTLELLMASQTHMGHHTSLWNPANSRYIHGVREGIHIISLETTAAHLRRAARVVEEVLYGGGLVLFAGTRLGHMEIVVKAAEMAGACYLFTKWTPGSITNRDVILKTHPVKVVDHNDKEIHGFRDFVASARPLMPSLVVCLNPLENYTLLYECSLKNIPTIGVIDTDADPSWVTYTIPSNDDSLRAMAVIGGVLGRAGQRGTERRLYEAAKGQITWTTPPELTRHMNAEVNEAKKKQKEVMKMMQDDLEEFNAEELRLLQQKREAEARGQVDEKAVFGLLGGKADEREASAVAAALVVDGGLPMATAVVDEGPPNATTEDEKRKASTDDDGPSKKATVEDEGREGVVDKAHEKK
ncbi:hypothetical protein L249_7579 [Ophiocordyceps polyrhachis-furcata BCC 54312]|uniref:CBS domain-containing protein n=1 Tax=Ophiocordyceps polyrhachis-furcata BCC 54312 TaxID=1330021 RepID=A0A367LB17_9HYPO|nr:hypothetical protein L249_7579 [Ophiocordyceps polyrhachis-furcata BCC 54312]